MSEKLIDTNILVYQPVNKVLSCCGGVWPPISSLRNLDESPGFACDFAP